MKLRLAAKFRREHDTTGWVPRRDLEQLWIITTSLAVMTDTQLGVYRLL